MINFIKKHLKKIIILLIILSLGFGAYKFFTRKKPPELKTYTVTTSSITSFISASGEVHANREVKLHFQTLGKLAWVGVQEGDYVSAWQGIASLDQQVLKKTLIKTLRDYSKERNDFEEDRLDTYRYVALNDTIKRILEKNQWDLDKAVLDVEIDDITLKLANLVTPISGVVTRVDTPVAGVNVITTDLFVITDPDSIIFQAEVDEIDIGQITLGQSVKVILDSYPDQEFYGTVEKIGFSAITTSSGGIAFNVDISLPLSSGIAFKPGMNGDVEIILAKKENIITVPFEALVEEEEATYVYLLENETPIKTRVETGIEGDTDIEIIDGLRENQVIVLNPDELE